MAKTPQKRVAETKNEPDFDDPFIEEVVKRVRAVVGREQAAKVAAQIVSLYSEERFSGPIAHPRHLREYDEIVPGSADRIIQMAERSLSHSQDMQHKALQADIQDQKDGRKYGFFALLALIIAALISGLTGSELLAGGFLTTGALGTIAVFIKGRMSG